MALGLVNLQDLNHEVESGLHDARVLQRFVLFLHRSQKRSERFQSCSAHLLIGKFQAFCKEAHKARAIRYDLLLRQVELRQQLELVVCELLALNDALIFALVFACQAQKLLLRSGFEQESQRLLALAPRASFDFAKPR